MKQTCKAIKEQLTPDRSTVNELLERIRGGETAAVKTGGMRWAALVPLTAALGLALLGGMVMLGTDDTKLDTEPVNKNETIQQLNEEDKPQFGYPAAQVETEVTAPEGKFDLRHGGYYSFERHQPQDPPDEATKLRLLKQNPEIEIYLGTNTVYGEEAENADYVEVLSDGTLVGLNNVVNIYKAVDETFLKSYHVSHITKYHCMGKITDGDRIYELLVGFTDLGDDTIGISFGDGKYYLYNMPEYDLKYNFVQVSLVIGDNWKATAESEFYADVLTDQDGFNDEQFEAFIDAIKDNVEDIHMQNDYNLKVDENGELYDDGTVHQFYQFVGIGDRSEFDDSDLFGIGSICYSQFGGDYNINIKDMILNSPDENGVIAALLPGDRVLKFKPYTGVTDSDPYEDMVVHYGVAYHVVDDEYTDSAETESAETE